MHIPRVPRPGVSQAACAMCLLMYVFGAACTSAEQSAYVGQTPPDTVAEMFAPGLVSVAGVYEYGSILTANGLELFYGVNVETRAEIRGMRWTNGGWSPSAVVVGDERYTFGDPFLSPDERRLYFISDRPLPGGGTAPKDFDIWYVERNANGWSDPVNVDRVNSTSDEYYVSFASSGRIYFASNRRGGDRVRDFDVYAADSEGDGFGQPSPLRGNINTRYYEADAFVAPDESYLIYSSSRPGGLGQGDLYISLRGPDGSWSEGRNLGPSINSDGHELCPFVTADGRFFFFTSKQDVYWVDASILDGFR